MKLTRNEKAAILAGGTPQITRPTKPDLEPGTKVVLAHSKPKRYWDETTSSVFGAPREPSAWITVTKVVRHRKGGWVVRYDITDNRQPALLMARGSGYTTDPTVAIDDVEAQLSHKDRQRLAVEARARYAAQKEKDIDERRRQERAFKMKLVDALNGLDPLGAQLLLADLERRLEQAKRDGRADEAA